MAARHKPQGGHSTFSIPLFLVTFTRSEKAVEIFKVTIIGHVVIKVECYRAQGGLMQQCYNCQKIGHVWANCRQQPPPHRCLWCGGGPLHKKCPEKDQGNSNPSCCKCTVAEGEKIHPSNYSGCSQAKEELLFREVQKASKAKNPTGSVFSRHKTPSISFAAAVRGDHQPRQSELGQPQPQQVQLEGMSEQVAVKQSAQQRRQSVVAPCIGGSSPDGVLRVTIAVQQIMTPHNGAVSDKDKIVVITKILIKPVNLSGH